MQIPCQHNKSVIERHVPANPRHSCHASLLSILYNHIIKIMLLLFCVLSQSLVAAPAVLLRQLQPWSGSCSLSLSNPTLHCLMLSSSTGLLNEKKFDCLFSFRSNVPLHLNDTHFYFSLLSTRSPIIDSFQNKSCSLNQFSVLNKQKFLPLQLVRGGWRTLKSLSDMFADEICSG